MSDVLSALVSAGSVQAWLAVAGLAGSVALATGAVRYRNLYKRTLGEQTHQRELIENLSEGIYRSLPNGKQLSANRALVKLNGYDSEAEMLACIDNIGTEWYVDPGRRDEPGRHDQRCRHDQRQHHPAARRRRCRRGQHRRGHVRGIVTDHFATPLRDSLRPISRHRC